ncbi:MAG TPA: ice-binding family protein, partial [Thermoleophilaceae bacterium]|nr:ice-binding family protein [Thermoleophilaceae bacterium]
MSRIAAQGKKRAGAGLLAVASMMSLLFAAGAQAQAPVGLGTAGNFSVLGATTITNPGATTMARDLGLHPGTEVTGAPQTLGASYIADAEGVALRAKNALTAAKIDAAGRAVTASAGTELAGRTFTPGVYNASSTLIFSSGILTLDAVGNPNAVFIFQVGSSLTTLSGTTVRLINGAQPCNVYWEIGEDVDLGTNSVFMGTVMAGNRITAATGATLDGRLLASNAAVNLNNNTITTS